MIYPAVHYTMGGVWVDYNLMTSIPGCYAIGEAKEGGNPLEYIKVLMILKNYGKLIVFLNHRVKTKK